MKTALHIFALLTISANAFAQSQTLAFLERAISPDAASGELISLRDAHCRYTGELIRESSDSKNMAANLVPVALAASERWHIDISQKACGDIVEKIKMRVDLPKAPSLAGGGGIPQLPYGYESGTKFSIKSN